MKTNNIEDVLYHYTCKQHLPKILESGYLKLTDSNLIPPDGSIETEIKSKNYKPVVWLTDSTSTEGHGLEGTNADKTEIKVTVRRKPSMKYWKSWAKRNHMDKSWMALLAKGRNASSWFVSEEIIPLSDVIKIVNRYDGTVYYENDIN